MGKKVINLTESDLKNTIRKTIVRILNESTDEIFDSDPSPISPLAAALRAKDIYGSLGREKLYKPIKGRKTRQFDLFSKVALDRINDIIGNRDYIVVSDPAKRRLKGYWTKDGKSAYIPAEMEDISGIRVYDDNWKEGDALITLGDLPEFPEIERCHQQLRDIIGQAENLNASSLEESINRIVRKVIKEGLGYYPDPQDQDAWSDWRRPRPTGWGKRFTIKANGEILFTDVPESTIKEKGVDYFKEVAIAQEYGDDPEIEFVPEN